MQVIKSDNYKKLKEKNCCLAIGAFDGLHKGHQLIINEAIKEAKQNNFPAAVLSFFPHPLEIIPAKTPPPALVSRRQKISILEDLGVDYYFEQKFDKDFAQLKAEDFIKNILIKKLKVNTVVVGSDFRFAYKNEGNAEILNKMAEIHNFNSKIISQLHADENRISSTRIRRLLKKGKLKKAKQLLGRPYQICGRVNHGREIGRKLGFPTANVKMESDYVLPPKGVYAVKVHHSGKQYIGAANLGFNPTFKKEELSFEIYILDFNDDIYNERICVDIHKYLRPEKKFDDIEALKEQMEKDVLYTRKILC